MLASSQPRRQTNILLCCSFSTNAAFSQQINHFIMIWQNVLYTYILAVGALNAHLMSALSTQRVLCAARSITCRNKQHEASVIVFITPLEAALVLHDASRPFSALSYCVMNDSARFSATPVTDATRKNYWYVFLPITIVPPINYRCPLIGKTDESVDL